MLKWIHKTAALMGFGLIAGFFTSTLIVELFGSESAVALVKAAIFYLIFLLVPLMMTAALTGRKLAKGRPLDAALRRKMRRTPLIGLNAVLILIPLAVVLHRLSVAGEFGLLFYALQGAELLFGLANLVMLALNMRDGRALKA